MIRSPASTSSGDADNQLAAYAAALRVLTSGKLLQLKAGATLDNLDDIRLAEYRIEALQKAIKTRKEAGTCAHLWLSQEQVTAITARPDRDTLIGRRDWIVLAVLLGAGLRREELSNLTFDDLKQQPTKTGTRDVLEVKGKGDKFRVIPIRKTVADGLRQWQKETGGGRIARSINGTIGESLSPSGINDIVKVYGGYVGLPTLAPHDMRRTFARLAYEAGVPVEQISRLLGHADVKTTMLYLGITDLEDTASDHIEITPL